MGKLARRGEDRTLTEADVEDLGWKHDAAGDGQVDHPYGIHRLGQHLVDVAQDHRAQAAQGRRGVQEGPEPAATLALRRGGLVLGSSQEWPAGREACQGHHALRSTSVSRRRCPCPAAGAWGLEGTWRRGRAGAFHRPVARALPLRRQGAVTEGVNVVGRRSGYARRERGRGSAEWLVAPMVPPAVLERTVGCGRIGLNGGGHCQDGEENKVLCVCACLPI
jgi:hypothetical protein